MSINCSVCRDLLPLYLDDVCSSDSKKLIESHIGSCSECKKILDNLKCDEINGLIKPQIKTVIEEKEKRQKKRTVILATVFSVIFMIPILISLIVNLFSTRSLDWFFIVLTSLLLAYSIIVVPIIARANKFIYSCVCAVSSLILLLLSACIYSGGRWFFVSALSVLFAISVILLPIILSNKAINDKIGGYKAVICLICDIVLYFAMMISIGFYVNESGFMRLTIAFSAVPLILFIVLMLLFRYLPIKTVSKFGIAIILFDISVFLYEGIVNIILGITKTQIFNIGGTIELTIFLSLLILGVILVLLGVVFRRSKS